MIFADGVLIAWLSWTVLEAPCHGTDTQVARQRLSPTRVGIASVSVSADGRFVAFVSLARLLPADGNVVDDVYVLDRVSGRLSLESVGVDGRASNGSSDHPRLSADGRILVFASIAPALLGTRDPAGPQVLRRDRTTGTTTLVSRTRSGTTGNNWTGHPDVSDDGRYVVFESRATDLVPGDANGTGTDVYLYDASDGAIRRLSVTAAGDQPPDGESTTPAISGDGRVVAFTSSAPLDGRRPAAGPPRRGVFLRDLETGVLRRLSATRDRGVADGDSFHPSISADGRRVAFASTATDLDDDARATAQENVYLFDSQAPRLRLVSRSASGGIADGGSRFPAVSGNGRYVIFSSDASNLHCVWRCGASADLNLVSDVYRADTATGRVERVSGGAAARAPWWNASAGAATDGSGRIVAFSSREPIHAADLDHDDDLYVEALPAHDGNGDGSRAVPPCAPAAARPHAQPAPLAIARGPRPASESSSRMLVRGSE